MSKSDVDELNSIMLNLSKNLERLAIAAIDGAHPESVRANWRRYCEEAEVELVAWSDRRTAAVLERLGAILQLDNNIYKVDYLLAKAIDDELAALSIKDKEEK